ncbi:hypothetical protein ALC56_14798 [Trachymyrmex septentrionalis]|uniref:Uncharacterized protein n=1 Tax=Trachymyrmex septentrionalis TaxID=34720 RepID=A0A195ES31_9HYME|nr:hypothetical protein ALC56_14798 [Trachymyrmex septentrionalis]
MENIVQSDVQRGPLRAERQTRQKGRNVSRSKRNTYFPFELDERRRDAVDFYVEAIVDALCHLSIGLLETENRGFSLYHPIGSSRDTS